MSRMTHLSSAFASADDAGTANRIGILDAFLQTALTVVVVMGVLLALDWAGFPLQALNDDPLTLDAGQRAEAP